MGWGKKLRKAVRKVTNVGSSVGKFLDKSLGTGHVFTTVGQAFDLNPGSQALETAVDAATHTNVAKEKEAAQKATIAAQETAAKNAADADYYNQIMKSRRQQIADNAGSQTNFTTEEGAFGSFDSANLGGFDPITGAFGRKKKVVR